MLPLKSCFLARKDISIQARSALSNGSFSPSKTPFSTFMPFQLSVGKRCVSCCLKCIIEERRSGPGQLKSGKRVSALTDTCSLNGMGVSTRELTHDGISLYLPICSECNLKLN